MEYRASASIAAPPEKVWDVLTDVAKWPEWDPFCDKIEGELALGNKIKAFSKLSPGRAFPVKVTDLSAPTRMEWSGGMPLGLFKGVRTFELEATPTGTSFTMHEKFSGPMLALIGRSIPDMSEAFEKFALGLKHRSES